MKKIIWLDDHFEEKFKILMERFLDEVEKNAEVIQCKSIEEFHEKFNKIEVNGIIIDVMLRMQIEENFRLFGAPSLAFHTTTAGMQLTRILLGMYPTDIEYFHKEVRKRPILILTNEHEDPIKSYASQHSDIIDYINNPANPTSLKIHSKGEHDIVKKLCEWINELSNERERWIL